MRQIPEHPDIRSAERTGYPSWWNWDESSDDEDEEE